MSRLCVLFDRAKLLQILQDGVTHLPLQLDARQLDLLIDYLALLVKWNAVYNLTAVRDPEQMVVQHLLDTLAVVPAFAGAQNVLDVGAGGRLARDGAGNSAEYRQSPWLTPCTRKPPPS